jgi:hypothetical protein
MQANGVLQPLQDLGLVDFNSVTAKKKQYSLNAYQRPTIPWSLSCESGEQNRVNAFEVIYQYRSIGFEALNFKDITLKFMLAPFGVSLLVAIAFSCCLCSNSNLEKLSLCFVLMCFVALVCFASSVYGLQGLVRAILNFKASQMVGEQKGDANQQAWVNSCLPPPY